MKKLAIWFVVVLLVIFGNHLVASADTWRYDFDPGEDISMLTQINPTGIPTITLNGTLEMDIPSTAAYDLASWVNLNAPRLYRSVVNEPFILETKLSTTFSTYTFLTGLFLYNSADGVSSNDLIFGANSSSLKIDAGNPSQHSGAFAWTSVGSYVDLFLRVEHDGSGNYDFFYNEENLTGGQWEPYASLSGYSFDNLGIIAKTWYNPSAGYPELTANFDYLHYNVPIPGAVWLLGFGLLGLVGSRRKLPKA